MFCENCGHDLESDPDPDPVEEDIEEDVNAVLDSINNRLDQIDLNQIEMRLRRAEIDLRNIRRAKAKSTYTEAHQARARGRQ